MKLLLNIPRFIFSLFVILIDAHHFNALIEIDPTIVQMLVESRLVAGKVIALMAEVDVLLLMAFTYTAPGKQFAPLLQKSEGFKAKAASVKP